MHLSNARDSRLVLGFSRRPEQFAIAGYSEERASGLRRQLPEVAARSDSQLAVSDPLLAGFAPTHVFW